MTDRPTDETGRAVESRERSPRGEAAPHAGGPLGGRAAEGHAPGHDPGHARSEEDRVSPGPIVAVGVGALVVFFLASWVTISYLRVKQGDRPPLPIPAELGQSKIALVEQQLFELSTRGLRDRDAQRERLGSYGWVDRKAGVVRIPIDRAMELSAQGVRPRVSAPPSSTPEAQP
jgi:hypothetical protein